MTESKPLLAGVRLSDPAVLFKAFRVAQGGASYWSQTFALADLREDQWKWVQLRTERWQRLRDYIERRLLSLLERQTYALKVAAEGTEIDELYGALCEADHWKRLYERAKQSLERQTAVVTKQAVDMAMMALLMAGAIKDGAEDEAREIAYAVNDIPDPAALA